VPVSVPEYTITTLTFDLVYLFYQFANCLRLICKIMLIFSEGDIAQEDPLKDGAQAALFKGPVRTAL
jgi:hypothetical protein